MPKSSVSGPADAGDDAAGAPGQAHGGAAGAARLPVMRAEGNEPPACGVFLGSDSAAGDGPPALGADAFRALLRSHLRAIRRRSEHARNGLAGQRAKQRQG